MQLRRMVEEMDPDGDGVIDAMEMIKFVQARLSVKTLAIELIFQPGQAVPASRWEG